jgi:hypothetical protein
MNRKQPDINFYRCTFQYRRQEKRSEFALLTIGMMEPWTPGILGLFLHRIEKHCDSWDKPIMDRPVGFKDGQMEKP